ncbi:MAG: PP2C family protein-serine/threonine phosphatase [Ilumatobacteraceae bacterium]
MPIDAEPELVHEVARLRAALVRERRARELRSEVGQLTGLTTAEADRSGVAQVIADGVPAIFSAGWAMVGYVGDESVVHLKHGPGVPAAIAHDWSEIPLETDVPVCEVLRGESSRLELPDRDHFDRWPLMRLEADRANMASLVAYAIGPRANPSAVVAIAWPAPHLIDEPERELLELLVRSAWPAFNRSVRTEIDGEMARALQTWLLDSKLADVPGVEIETLYQPGQDLLTVGGDWFDVIDLGAGRAAVVVGDVVGHDVEAAVAMSQVRHVLAANLVAQGDPAAAIDMTDAYLRRRTERTMATAVVIVFEGDGLVTVSSAGHPPPIVATVGRPAMELPVALGPPIGSGLGTHSSRQSRLEPGATIVAYTDGVVEERAAPLDVAIAELVQAVGAAADSARNSATPIAPSMISMLNRRVGRSRRTDDTAAVVMHLKV